MSKKRTCSLKPESSLSVSSSTSILMNSVRRNCLRDLDDCSKSKMCPGVPRTTCTPFSTILRSLTTDVPPMQPCALTPKYSPRACKTLAFSSASSRVGTRTNAWHSTSPISSRCKIPEQSVAVLPVPECAC